MAGFLAFFDTLRAAARLAVLRQPKGISAIRPMPHFWLSALLLLWCYLMLEVLVGVRRVELGLDLAIGPGFDRIWIDFWILAWWSFQTVAILTISTLALASLCASVLGKPFMSFSVASLWLLASMLALVPLVFVATLFMREVDALGVGQSVVALGFIATYLTLILFATLRFCFGAAFALRRAAMALFSAVLFSLIGSITIFALEYYLEPAPDALLVDEGAALEPKLPYNPEKVMYKQQRLLERALSAVPAGVPGRPELFVLSFGSDASEGVFLNEVSYSKRLFEERFGARGRVLMLANHPHTTDELALATATNLRAALRGLAQKMDRAEDLLFVYLTTHGAATHELLVQQGPLPLDQISPQALAQALDQSGIRYQIVVVSACYSGGFVGSLKRDTRVVMTAANSTQPSFGCGAESDITYFGQAYLVEALNQTSDFVKAFEIAEKAVTEREQRMGFAPSKPQIAAGADALAQIRLWKKQFEPGDPVPFFPDSRNRRVQ
jgi:hypothetical protein